MQLWRYGLAIERLGGRYRLEGSLGSGGMADVCLAWDEQTQREVAIKVIKADELEQRTLNRFLKEAAQVSKWRHPHILRFYGEARLELLDPTRGSVVPYIVMEYAQGGDLYHRLHKGQPYPLSETLALFSQLCSAVAYAHVHGLIHRDLKPQNVLFRRLADGSEQALLSDFGLAVEVSATHHTFARGGTLPYMAPEQLAGQPVPASDIFALGVILYQLCTGRLPFQRTLQDLRRSAPLPLPPLPSTLNPELPASLDAVILQALADEPEQRYTNADEFWVALKYVATTTYRTADTPLTASNPPSTAKIPLAPPKQVGTGLSPSASPRGLSPSASPSASLAPSKQVGTGLSPSFSPSASPSASLAPPKQVGTGLSPSFSPSASLAPTSQPEPQSDSFDSTPLLTSITGAYAKAPRQTSVHPASSLYSRQQTRPIPSSLPGKRPRSRVPLLLIPALLILVLPFLLLLNGQLNALIINTPLAVLSSDPTITITPMSQLVTHNYLLSLTHAPSAAANQLTSRTLTATTSNSQTVATTGKVQIPATQAKGKLLLFNGSFAAPFTVGAGTSVTGKDGVIVIIDATVTIPAADSNKILAGEASVPAHAGNPGAKGNIAALDINGACCTNNGIAAKNTDAFTGGQDAQNYHYPTQDDINSVANTAQTNLEQSARQQLQSQLAPNEQLAGRASCQLKTTTDHPVGQQGMDVPQVTVMVTDTCQAEAYPLAQLQPQITTQLQAQASSQLGAGYVQVGQIHLTTAVQPAQSPNTLPMLAVLASGQWRYTFGATQVHEMLLSIVSKNRAQTSVLLKQMRGVANVSIKGGGDSLPPQIEHIHIIFNAS